MVGGPRFKTCFGASRNMDMPEDAKPPQKPSTDIEAKFTFDAERLDDLERLVGIKTI